MAILVRIPAPLRRFTDGRSTVEADGRTISDVLQNLGSRYPGVLEKLYEGDSLRGFINLYLNDEDIRFLKGEDTAVKDGDQLSIIPAIAGGNRRP
jgi:molybdopterin synthase sulfur carrier subunit